MLSLHSVSAGYGSFRALFDVSLEVAAGEAVGVIGPNGAGKTTLMRVISGLIPVSSGEMRMEGKSLVGMPAYDIVGHGIAHVPENRRLFPLLSVEDNLRMGAWARRPGPWTLERVYTLFPALAPKARVGATALSGGQQQMVAIGRALMSNPALLLCDELSLGLAPAVIREVYAALPSIADEGMTVVVVEQDLAMAQQVSQRLYCFQEGRVALHGPSQSLTRDRIVAAYFGT